MVITEFMKQCYEPYDVTGPPREGTRNGVELQRYPFTWIKIVGSPILGWTHKSEKKKGKKRKNEFKEKSQGRNCFTKKKIKNYSR